MKKYIEIVSYETGEAVKRVEVTGKTENSIDKVERGININLNHEQFYTREAEEKEK